MGRQCSGGNYSRAGRFEGGNPHFLGIRVLRERRRVNVKDGAIRISMSFFNNEADIDCLLAALLQERVTA